MSLTRSPTCIPEKHVSHFWNGYIKTLCAFDVGYLDCEKVTVLQTANILSHFATIFGDSVTEFYNSERRSSMQVCAPAVFSFVHLLLNQQDLSDLPQGEEEGERRRPDEGERGDPWPDYQSLWKCNVAVQPFPNNVQSTRVRPSRVSHSVRQWRIQSAVLFIHLTDKPGTGRVTSVKFLCHVCTSVRTHTRLLVHERSLSPSTSLPSGSAVSLNVKLILWQTAIF